VIWGRAWIGCSGSLDTDAPHTHIVVRGKDERRKDLIISPEYIAHGMRARARELSTLWLGQRTDLEIRQVRSMRLIRIGGRS